MIEAIVWLLLIQDGNIFLLKTHNDFGEEYTLIGGHVEPNESLKKALKREVKEEIGINIEEKSLILKYVIDRRLGTKHKIHFFFLANNWQGSPYNNEPHIHLEAGWHPLSNLPKNVGPLASKAINSCNDGQLFSDYGW